jgi:hypothetical protein
MGDFIIWLDYCASTSQFIGLFVLGIAIISLIEDVFRGYK